MMRALFLGLAIFLIAACTSETDSTAGTTETVPEIAYPGESKNDDGSGNLDTGAYAASLQGFWKRTTYPYGSVQFGGGQVKFITGEGSAEEPRWQHFELTSDCPYTDEREQSGRGVAYMSVAGKELCEKLTLTGNRLEYITAGGGTIAYERQSDEAAVEEDGRDGGIPETIRGTWATESGKCAVRNHDRITITGEGIDYFEASAELRRQRERSATRILADFDYQRTHPDANRKTKIISLDVQEDGSRMVLREYQAGEDAGMHRYLRCSQN